MVNRRIVNSNFFRGYALGLLENKKSVVQVSRQLGVSKRTIFRWRREFRAGKVLKGHSPGRGLKTSDRSNRLLVRLAKAHHLSSARELIQFWRERVCVSTVYRRLRASGIRKRRRLVVPVLTPRHREERLRWAMTRVLWRAVWGRVIFTDESRFKRIGSDGRILVWRMKGERYLDRNVSEKPQGQGGSVHVWGAIWRGGRSRLHVLRQNVNQRTYVDTLDSFFGEEALPDRFIFQDDNAPAHRAAAVVEHLQNSHVHCLPWPARSPDLNPIEHVWDYISRKLNSRPHTAQNLRQLEEWILEEWQALSQEIIDALIDSIPRRIICVIEARGGHTKY